MHQTAFSIPHNGGRLIASERERELHFISRRIVNRISWALSIRSQSIQLNQKEREERERERKEGRKEERKKERKKGKKERKRVFLRSERRLVTKCIRRRTSDICCCFPAKKKRKTFFFQARLCGHLREQKESVDACF